MALTLTNFDAAELTTAVQNIGNAQEKLLTRRFFLYNPGRNQHATKFLEFGSLTETVRIVNVRRPGESAAPVDLTRGSLKVCQFPKIYVSKAFGEKEAETLNPGLSTYQGKNTNPNEHFLDNVNFELAGLKRSVRQTFEVWASLALTTGSLTLTYEDTTTATVDYGYTGNGTLVGDSYTIQPSNSGDALWTAATGKPIDDLEDLVLQVQQESDYEGNFAVLAGKNAWKALANSDKVMKQLDARNLEAGRLMFKAGATYKGNLNGLEILSYNCGYKNSAGTWVNVFDQDTIALVPLDDPEVFSREQGPCWDEVNGMAQWINTEMYSRTITETNPAQTLLTLETRPIPLIKKPTAIRIKKVV